MNEEERRASHKVENICRRRLDREGEVITALFARGRETKGDVVVITVVIVVIGGFILKTERARGELSSCPTPWDTTNPLARVRNRQEHSRGQ